MSRAIGVLLVALFLFDFATEGGCTSSRQWVWIGHHALYGALCGLAGIYGYREVGR